MKSNRIIIREAVSSDYPQIIELFREFSVYQKLPERMHNTLERMREEQEFLHCFVAENEEKEIIGYATWFFTYFTWSGKGLYIDDLYVKSLYRGKGIGLQLMEKVIALGKTEKCHKIRWQVSWWNESAIAFYKKLGAEIDEIEKNCDLNLD